MGWELVAAMTEWTDPESRAEVALGKAVEDGLALPARDRLIGHHLRFHALHCQAV